MSTEVYFSVDIEADGTIPGPYSMSSFGAVACAMRDDQEHRKWQVSPLDIDDPQNSFYSELQPISNSSIPAAARVSGLSRDHLIENGTLPRVAMKSFDNWVSSTTERLGGQGARAVFVAYPLAYDWMWVYWYLINFAGHSPFGHSTTLDIKTLLATKTSKLIRKTGKRTIPKRLRSTRPHTHNALDDAKEQGELFVNIVNDWS